MTPIERFMLKVDKSDTHSGCWVWTGSVSGSGYGRFWDGKNVIQAHWFLIGWKKTKGKDACHKCDNKLCVKPNHVFIGTRSENMKDMVSKGRHNPDHALSASLKARGFKEKKKAYKITRDKALICKSCTTERGAVSALSRKLGISRGMIRNIRDGKSWHWIQ
jgi:HNH endonuclease